MPEFVRFEWRRPLECTLILLHFMVLLRIRVVVPLTLTRGPDKHETKKRQTDIEFTTPHTSPPVDALHKAGFGQAVGWQRVLNPYLTTRLSPAPPLASPLYVDPHRLHGLLEPPSPRRTARRWAACCLTGRIMYSGSNFSEAESNPYRVTPHGNLKNYIVENCLIYKHFSPK